MGNCCSYVLRFDPSKTVADPLSLNEIQKAVDKESQNKSPLGKKSQSVKRMNQDTIPKSQGNGLILSLSTNSPLKKINEKPSKESGVLDKNSNASMAKTQTLHVEPEQNSYLMGNGSKTVQSNPSSLLPFEIVRKDQRALTSREEENNETIKEKKAPVVNIEDLRINDVILKKIEKINLLAVNNKDKNKEDGVLRSQTLGNENDLFEDEGEATGTNKTKKKEEIKKTLIENKEIIEKQLEKKPSKQLGNREEEKEQIRSKSIEKKPTVSNNTNNTENKADEPLPRKSLLKRYKTIGDDGKKEKSKKKVKFKDLFDARGKKKVKRTKRP